MEYDGLVTQVIPMAAVDAGGTSGREIKYESGDLELD